jgi:hypothetical protein
VAEHLPRKAPTEPREATSKALRKIGNSFGVILPKELLDSLRMQFGHRLRIAVSGEHILISRWDSQASPPDLEGEGSPPPTPPAAQLEMDVMHYLRDIVSIQGGGQSRETPLEKIFQLLREREELLPYLRDLVEDYQTKLGALQRRISSASEPPDSAGCLKY